MNQLNPYAAPQVANPFLDKGNQSTSLAGLWRQGNLLVMHKSAPLPNICLKSNEPATRHLRRNLSWHSPFAFLGLLGGLIPYVIIAVILTKKATLQAPLTEEWFARRRKRVMITWSIALLGVAMFVGGIAIADSDAGPLLIVAAIFTLLGAAVFGTVACRLFAPNRITDEYVWLKGVAPAFLDRLDPWPYNI